MMEGIKIYIGYIMGVLGFAGVVWTYATKTANKDYDVADLKKEVAELRINIVTKSDFKIFTDSIGIYNFRMEKKMNEVIISQNYFRSSYVKYIKSVVKDIDYFIELMNGLQFELVQSEVMKSVFPETKIRIIKSDSTKRK